MVRERRSLRGRSGVQESKSTRARRRGGCLAPELSGPDWQEPRVRHSLISPAAYAQDQIGGSNVKRIGERFGVEGCEGLSLSEGGTGNPISEQFGGTAGKGGRPTR